MPIDDTLARMKRRAELEAAKAALATLGRAALDKAGELGESALDDLEAALLGDRGAAAAAATADDDPLEALRARHGLAASPPEAPEAPAPGAVPAEAPAARSRADEVAEREARARAELAELKKRLGKG